MLFDSFYDWLLFYGYYIGQLLIILSFFLLALRTRKILIYITLIGFVLFFIGNIIMLRADSALADLKQTKMDMHRTENIFNIGRSLSSIGFVSSSLSLLFFSLKNRK